MRMHRLLLNGLAAAAVLAGPALAQDSQAIEVANFSEIDAGGQYTVRIVQGDSRSVTLNGDAGDFGDIEIEVRRGELRLRQDTGGWFSRRRNRQLDVTVDVVVPNVRVLDFHRGVSVEAADLDLGALELAVNTGAVVTLAGTCSGLELDVSTGGVLNARDLVCETVEADGSTGGEAFVHATARIEAGVSTGAMIHVYGEPQSRNVRSSLGGEVSFR